MYLMLENVKSLPPIWEMIHFKLKLHINFLDKQERNISSKRLTLYAYFSVGAAPGVRVNGRADARKTEVRELGCPVPI